MADNAHMIEKRIAELRERMRGTLDRSKLPALRDQIMEEIAKLKELGGTADDTGRPARREEMTGLAVGVIVRINI
jgi:hypothetical protein